MSPAGAPGLRPRFFLPADDARATDRGAAFAERDLTGAELELGPEDAHHARAVLRLQPGDQCDVVVGAAVYAAAVSAVGDSVTVRLRARLDESAAGASYRLEVGLVQALARPAVMDYVFEKGTEVGASFFILATAAGSPKWALASLQGRLDRWARIAREAAKQSKHVAVPRIDFAGSVQQALEHVASIGALSLVLQPGAASGLEAALGDRQASLAASPLALWVGPEGGWTGEESELFVQAGLTAARLGRAVLRTETAGPVAVAAARLVVGDW